LLPCCSVSAHCSIIFITMSKKRAIPSIGSGNGQNSGHYTSPQASNGTSFGDIHPVLSRQRPFCSLELFSGFGMVSQQLALKGWQTMWFDTTAGGDFMDFRFQHMHCIPDFIYVSMRCLSYSHDCGKWDCGRISLQAQHSLSVFLIFLYTLFRQ
jgi:hypothetical protein